LITKILLGLCLGVPFTIINFSGYLKGNTPSIFQIFSSIVFLLLWLLWGVHYNYRNKDSTIFLKFSTLYWISAFVFVFVMNGIDWIVFSIPTVIIFLGPLYGLRYYIPNVSYESFAYISLIVAYAISLIGSLLGYITNKSLVKK
jgi:hypothetical protein